MDKFEIAAQEEIDRQILAFVRGMQESAPVTADSIFAYLRNHARIRCTPSQADDRIAYLHSAGLLEKFTEWDAGEITRYEITALGMDLLDGKVPPRNWKPKT